MPEWGRGGQRVRLKVSDTPIRAALPGTTGERQQTLGRFALSTFGLNAGGTGKVAVNSGDAFNLRSVQSAPACHRFRTIQC